MGFEKQVGLFFEETAELLDLLESRLLQLKEQPDDTELLNTVFRAFHTIKGSSSMFGYDSIASFTHELESLFDRYRQGGCRIPDHVLGSGLQAVDCIRSLLADGDTEEARIARGSILSSLSAERASPETSEEQPQPPGRSEPESCTGQTVLYRIQFQPSQLLFKSGCNPASVFCELRSLGECRLTMFTSDIPEFSSLDPELCYVSWLILLSTTRGENAIRDAFVFVEHLARITITKVDWFPAAPNETPKKLGEILVEHGALNPADVQDIQAQQKRFGSIAVEKGFTDPARVAGALAEQEMVKSNLKEHRQKLESASIRVRNDKLDTLVDLVGELVTLHARFCQEASSAKSLKILTLTETLGQLADDLRATAMSIRMVPVAETFNGFRRLVHDLSEELSKKILLEISGGETELDKNIIGGLKDALMHLVRNAADHGIERPEVRTAAGKPEAGTVRLSAGYEGSVVKIAVEDDGAGLDRERISRKAVERGILCGSETDEQAIFRTIFAPGFSTAEKTTSLSGRGVGMDVVKKSVENLRGTIRLDSRYGQGTRIEIRIPLTLGILDGLVLEVGSTTYILDLESVEECVDLTPELRNSGGGRNLIILRNEVIPYLVVREEFALSALPVGIERMVVTVVDGKKIGLVVDQVIGKRQVVIKPLPKHYAYSRDISGSAILGNGSVALILDAQAFVRSRYVRIDTSVKEARRTV